MKSLESRYFKSEYPYNPRLVNKGIEVIQMSTDTAKVDRWRGLLFRMMRDIVKKNISNYLNLLNGINGIQEIPSRDEVISECYVTFVKCVDSFVLNQGYNFYFYYNKSLSRNFYRYYQKAIKTTRNIELTEIVVTVKRAFHYNPEPNLLEVLYTNVGFTDIEKTICESKMIQQSSEDFFKNHPEINSTQYSTALRRIKKILSELKEKGEL